MKNLAIAKIFREIADILEFEGVPFKPQAYRRAALKIENFKFDLCAIGGVKELMEIPGIGESIAKKIVEICESGQLDYLEKIRKEINVDLTGLEEVEGLGPKKVKKLFERLNIKTLPELKKAAEEGKIRAIEGFGVLSENKLLQNIHLVENRLKRFLYGQIQFQVETFLTKIRRFEEVKQVEAAGSFRRHQETIGDLDILIVTSQPEKVSQQILKLPEIKKIIAQGPKKISFDLENDLRVDIRYIEAKSFGSALLYFTGNKDFNIKLRLLAIKYHWKLSEYGLFANEKFLAGRTEEEIFQKLGLNFIPPECREDNGEIEIALKQDFNFLVPPKLPQADLHLHTHYSDGENTMEEMTQTALKLGLNYIAIADHTGSLAIANPLNDNSFDKYLREIEHLNQKYPQIKILKGAEVNILADGTLDLSAKWLEKLDLVIGSIHSALSNDADKNTARYLKALDNPYLNIIGHPTGRRFNLKEGMEFDYQLIFQKAAEKHVALEINASIDRLDLPTHLLRLAKENGCKFVINTDSHTTESLPNLWLGVYHARRAFLETSDILNFAEIEKLLQYFHLKNF